MFKRKKADTMMDRSDDEVELGSVTTGNASRMLKPQCRQWKSVRSWRLVLGLWVAWVALIHYYEHTVVVRAMKKCQWNKWEQWENPVGAHHVALFADPQIMDNHSYPGRPAIVNYFTRVILDHYLARNWKYVQGYLEPQTSVFLGDLFDGGRYWDDKYWFNEYQRFNRIFPRKPGTTTITNVAGNHDIGFGDTVVKNSLLRFSAFFGETSDYFHIGNHIFVVLDTISLSDSADPHISEKPRDFLEKFGEVDPSYPRIMLSHVPLWRDVTKQTCGSRRESSNLFPVMKGDQYQTVITEEISNDVLDTIKPILLFSGDDHDYCHIKHEYTPKDGSGTKLANEYTVKSCAMNMGISKPAIQLLSLYNPQSEMGIGLTGQTYSTEMCYMPDPYKPLTMYIIAAIFCLIILIKTSFFPKRYIRSKYQNFAGKIKKVDETLPMPVSISDAQLEDKKLKASLQSSEEQSKFAVFFQKVGSLAALVLATFFYYYCVI